jgi:hypothetical protein
VGWPSFSSSVRSQLDDGGPGPSMEIEADIRAIEQDILRMLPELTGQGADKDVVKR